MTIMQKNAKNYLFHHWTWFKLVDKTALMISFINDPAKITYTYKTGENVLHYHFLKWGGETNIIGTLEINEAIKKRPDKKAIKAKSHEMLAHLQPLARVLYINLFQCSKYNKCFNVYQENERFYKMYSAFRGYFEDENYIKEYLVEVRPNNKFRVYIGDKCRLYTEITI